MVNRTKKTGPGAINALRSLNLVQGALVRLGIIFITSGISNAYAPSASGRGSLMPRP